MNRSTLLALAAATLITGSSANAETVKQQCHPNLDFEIRTLNENKMINLCDTYQGKVILIVNTASIMPTDC